MDDADTGSDERPDSPRRSARLPAWILVPGMILLSLSFLSGLFLWIAQSAAPGIDGLEPVGGSRARFWLQLHGALNPLVCVFLGCLVPRHIRAGWRLRVNRFSGAAMVIVLAGLAGTGAALYYVGAEPDRTIVIWAHRALGLALPLTLAAHWFEAWRWQKSP